MRIKRAGRVAVALLLSCLVVGTLTVAPAPAEDLPQIKVQAQGPTATASITCTAYASQVRWTPIRVWADGYVTCSAAAADISVRVQLVFITSVVKEGSNRAYGVSRVDANVTHDTCVPGLYQAKTIGYVQAYHGYSPYNQSPESQGGLTLVTCR